MEQFKNQEVKDLVADVEVYGDLFINSFSKVKTQKERKDEKLSLEYYQQELMSLEDTSITGTRVVSQNHAGDGQEAKWKDMSPSTVAALQTRGVNTGELASVKGWSIAKLKYTKPYTIADKDVFSDTLVFAGDLEVAVTKRLEQLNLIKRKVAELTEA